MKVCVGLRPNIYSVNVIASICMVQILLLYITCTAITVGLWSDR